MKFFQRSPASTPSDDLLGVLTSMNELAAALRVGYDERAAAAIAVFAVRTLGVVAASVTDDYEALATVGDVSDEWEDAVLEQTAAFVDRQVRKHAVVYEVGDGEVAGEAAAVGLRLDDVVVGTIHVLAATDETPPIAELQEFAELVTNQLALAELEQSRTRAAEAELRALRAQISPHFVHNSLTAIAGLVNTDPGTARDLIATFAEFLRASFRTQTDLTTVSEELRLVEAYLELEQARFGGRFDVVLNIAPEALPVRLPFLTVQPVVENAITHGLEARPGAGHLSIVAENAGPEIAIHVEDDGVGIDPVQLQRALSGADSTPHVGILAVDTRLRSTFGPEYGLTIETGANAGTKVSIRLPKFSAPRV